VHGHGAGGHCASSGGWCRVGCRARQVSRTCGGGVRVDLPVGLAGPVEFDLARAVRALPGEKALPGGSRYEPKWMPSARERLLIANGWAGGCRRGGRVHRPLARMSRGSRLDGGAVGIPRWTTALRVVRKTVIATRVVHYASGDLVSGVSARSVGGCRWSCPVAVPVPLQAGRCTTCSSSGARRSGSVLRKVDGSRPGNIL
jgi:hypothetical protein